MGLRPPSSACGCRRDFLLPDGTPSARTIVEGANLFVTHEARQARLPSRSLPSRAHSLALCLSCLASAAVAVAVAVAVSLSPSLRLSVSPSLRLSVSLPVYTHRTYSAAWQALFEHCALPIVKDSSANKCGVICSSMEIVAGMLLDDKEFIALKPAYVPGVLAILRSLAR